MPLRLAVVLLVALSALGASACNPSPHVVRLTPPPTLLAPHPEPQLRSNTNGGLNEALVECRREIRVCNAQKQQIRNLYELAD